MTPLHTSDHPLVLADLANLRSVESDTVAFRGALRRIATLVIPLALADLELSARTVTTPLTDTEGSALARPVTVIGILRAAIPMVEAAVALVPDAAIGYLGLARNHETHEPFEYYLNLPNGIEDHDVLVVDPMLATGGSAVHAFDVLAAHGVTSARFCGLIGAPEGVERLSKHSICRSITLAALDSHLNEDAYIVPGLGDAGDRAHGT